MKRKGAFIISLDFELHWGLRDKRTVENYRKNLQGVWYVVPTLLKLFDKYKIHATWATVGFLFFETRHELLKCSPTKRPNYTDSRLDPYRAFSNIGNNEKEDPFHYAPSLIRKIASFPNQEIGSHTFSHYYCLENGQDIDVFRHDLNASITTAKRYGLNIESLILPRNQFNDMYMPVLRETGIRAYRGNQESWIYIAKSEADDSLLASGLRLMDAYFNISGHNCNPMYKISRQFPFNVRASRFLRPYSSKLRSMEPLRLRRILGELEYAAERGLLYHLWWHPHNFGADMDRNIQFLKKILDRYLQLKEIHGIESLNIGEVSDRLVGGYHER